MAHFLRSEPQTLLAKRTHYKLSLIQILPNLHSPRCERLTIGTHAHLTVLTRHPIAPPTAYHDPSAQAPTPDHPQKPSFLGTASAAATSISTHSYSKSVHPAHKCTSPRPNRPDLTTRPLTDIHHLSHHPQNSSRNAR